MASMFRQRFLVTVDEVEHKVTTNARDLAAAQGYDDLDTTSGAFTFGLRMAHAACLRLGIDVPTDFDVFLDELDGIETIDPDAASSPPQDAPPGATPGLPDPTQPEGSAS